MLIDTYIYSANDVALSAFCAGFSNVIGPLPGRAAITPEKDGDGNITPSRPAVGNPGLWYAAIRCEGAITPPSGISVCDTAIGQAVLGVWE
jgi:hypothetical protein